MTSPIALQTLGPLRPRQSISQQLSHGQSILFRWQGVPSLGLYPKFAVPIWLVLHKPSLSFVDEIFASTLQVVISLDLIETMVLVFAQCNSPNHTNMLYMQNVNCAKHDKYAEK
jgi:hypothetical protein